MNKLNEQGKAILAAIEEGNALMTADRWHAVRVLAADFEDDGEWFAPEFAAARKATEGLSWDFSTWREVADTLRDGSGKLGGVSLLEVVA